MLLTKTWNSIKLKLNFPVEVYWQLRQNELERLDSYCQTTNIDWEDVLAIAVEQAFDNCGLVTTEDKKQSNGRIYLLIALAGDERHFLDSYLLTEEGARSLTEVTERKVNEEIRKELLKLIL